MGPVEKYFPPYILNENTLVELHNMPLEYLIQKKDMP